MTGDILKYFETILLRLLDEHFQKLSKTQKWPYLYQKVNIKKSDGTFLHQFSKSNKAQRFWMRFVVSSSVFCLKGKHSKCKKKPCLSTQWLENCRFYNFTRFTYKSTTKLMKPTVSKQIPLGLQGKSVLQNLTCIDANLTIFLQGHFCHQN